MSASADVGHVGPQGLRDTAAGMSHVGPAGQRDLRGADALKTARNLSRAEHPPTGLRGRAPP